MIKIFLKPVWILFIFFIIFQNGCNSNQPDKITNDPSQGLVVDNFFKVNLSWVYELNMHWDTARYRFAASFNVIDDTVINGQKYIIAVVWQKDSTTPGAFDTCLYTVSNDSLLYNGSSPGIQTNDNFHLWKRAASKSRMAQLAFFDNPGFFPNGRLIYKFPLALHNTWTDSFWVLPDTLHTAANSSFKAERVETIDLPIGSFNCLVVHRQYHPFDVSIDIYDWLSSSGLVQRVIDFGILTKLNEYGDSIGTFHAVDSMFCTGIMTNNGTVVDFPILK